ncbi:MAG: DUF2284 domain-containing protein [Clostridia bacterium]|nr:DUF2284 domain-containing protein [Clostridia bacterium]
MKEKTFVREMDGYTVYRMDETVRVDDYLKECVDVPKFEALCRSCPNYGQRWSCPPFAFDPMEIWQKYSRLHLVTHIFEPGKGQTVQGMLEAHRIEKEKMLELLMEMEAEQAGSMALWAGTCDLCPACANAVGKPCRMPDKMWHSIEALGGDVGKTAELYFGYPILWIEGDKVPAYMTLMGGILYNE